MPIASSKGIAPYTGTFGAREFKHLYRRTHFGVSQSIISANSTKTLNQCISEYLTLSAEPSPPVNYYQSQKADPTVPYGQTWILSPMDVDFNGLRQSSFRRWLAGNCLTDNTATEKMTLFLHSFLPINSDVNDPRYIYNNYMMLRRNCFGNFKTIIKLLSIDPGMLQFLNGYLNQKNAPDENYARELMELFTLGKGYSPIYSESDIQEAAKVLTGYQIDNTTATYKFTSNRHDTSNKTFSAFFNNTVITGKTGAAGESELDDLINMIFAKDEVADYFVKKLYKFFCYYEIDSVVETNVIKPLAAMLRSNNYEILPVITALFKSEHFYDTYSVGCHIKSPADFTLGYVREMQVALPSKTDHKTYYDVLGELTNICGLLRQDLFNPPNVSGWEAYYQFPNFHENWINTDTIQNRNKISTFLLIGYTKSSFLIKADFLAVTASFKNPEDPNKLITEATEFLHSTPIIPEQVALLKGILLFGQTQDFYWTNAYNDYITNPTDASKKKIVSDLLTLFYKNIMELAEYQLI